MRTIKCAGRYGLVDRPCASDVRKPLVVARPVGDDRVWALIHTRTGYSAGQVRFGSVRSARAALQEVLTILDWNEMTIEGAKKAKGIEAKIREIAKRHAGRNLFGEPL